MQDFLSGLASGVGGGLSAGLIVALWVALARRGEPQPPPKEGRAAQTLSVAQGGRP